MRKLDVAFIYHLLAWTSACHASSSSSSSWRWHSHSHAVHTQGPTSNRAADVISPDVQPPLMYINVKQQHSSPPSITTVPVCSCTQPPAGLVSRNRLEEWCKNEGRDDKESAPGSSYSKLNRKPGLNNPEIKQTKLDRCLGPEEKLQIFFISFYNHERTKENEQQVMVHTVLYTAGPSSLIPLSHAHQQKLKWQLCFEFGSAPQMFSIVFMYRIQSIYCRHSFQNKQTIKQNNKKPGSIKIGILI